MSEQEKLEQEKQKLINQQRIYLHRIKHIKQRLIQFVNELKTTTPELTIAHNHHKSHRETTDYHTIIIKSKYTTAEYRLYHSHINMAVKKPSPIDKNQNAHYTSEKPQYVMYGDPLLIGILLFPFEDLIVKKHHNELAVEKTT